MTRHRICRVDEVRANAVTPFPLEGRGNVLLVRLPSGDLKAIGSRCPHQGANLEHGCVTGYSAGDCPGELHLERPGQVLRCPWHGFEFDLVSGKSVVEGKLRLRSFPIEVEGDDVFIVW